MKIGIDGRAAKWYRGTGIGTYAHELILNLNNTDAKNHYLVFLPDGSSLNHLNKNFEIEPIKAELMDNFWDEVSIPNLLDNHNMELYHVPQNGVGLSENISCKKVITLHDIIPLKMPETVSTRYLEIFNNQLPRIINCCDGIITVSEFSKDDIAKEFNFPRERIYVTHLAAENIYKPYSKLKSLNLIEQKYNINSNYILYVGGLSPRKNILGLIDAFSLINPLNRKGIKLVITGTKGISYEKYKERATSLKVLDDVIFTGFIPLEDLPLFYSGAEVLVYPSFYEGFGLPPLEAMACGTPVIASNLTSVPEVCNDSALLIDPYNIDELSSTIERVLNDPLLALKMKELGLARSMNFSWENTAIKTINAYTNIIKR